MESREYIHVERKQKKMVEELGGEVVFIRKPSRKCFEDGFDRKYGQSRSVCHYHHLIDSLKILFLASPAKYRPEEKICRVLLSLCGHKRG